MSDGTIVLFQGDSITDCGRGRDIDEPNVALGSGYVQIIAARLSATRVEKNYQFYNRGISGNRVVDLYARWKIDALNLAPDIVSILVGVNDTWHEFNKKNGVEPARYEKIYRELLAWTHEVLPKTKPVLCEPFVLVCGAVTKDWLPEMDARRKIVRELATEFNTVFVPFQAVFDQAAKKAPPEYWLRDGVHPTCAGHALMADAWVEAVGAI